MKISTQTSVAGARFGDEKTLQLLCDAGFECIDYTFADLAPSHPFYSDAYGAYYRALRAKADGLGMTYNQSHAHFPTFKLGDDAYNRYVEPLIRRALEVSSILGVRVCVVHPQMDNALTPEQEYERNLAFYEGLLPLCRQYGVKIGVENMWKYDNAAQRCIPAVCSTADEYIKYLDSLDPQWFVACLDIGHCEMRGVGDHAAAMIRALGKRLQALHVHDNDLVHDLHELPYLYNIDWAGIAEALKEVGYSGDFTFEADNFLKGFPDDLIPSASRMMSDVGHYIVGKYGL